MDHARTVDCKAVPPGRARWYQLARQPTVSCCIPNQSVQRTSSMVVHGAKTGAHYIRINIDLPNGQGTDRIKLNYACDARRSRGSEH